MERFAQVILLDSNHAPLTYTFLPDRLIRPVRADFFTSMVPEIPALSKSAALWLDGDACPVNVWQEVVDAFVSWAETNRLSAQVSSVVLNQSVPLTIEWNGAEVIRGIAKIAIMYALYKIPQGERYLPDLGALRDFVRLGILTTEDASRPFGPVKQWSGPHPAEEALRGVEFTYLLALVRIDRFVYCFVQLYDMGLYVVRVGSSPSIPSRLSTFSLQRRGSGDRFELVETEHSDGVMKKFANAAAASIDHTALP